MKSPRNIQSADVPEVEQNTRSSGGDYQLHPKLLVKIHDLMVRSRKTEERMIKMYKQSEGYFWIGGPGEEAFNTCLGLQVKKGQGVENDFLHLHYRCSAILNAMGMEPKDAIRQMKNTATDPFSGGRNFANHYSVRKWNVVPVTSTIETQHATAIGTGIAQRQHGGEGITIVQGGDAGTAEGEFASCLVWASRPGFELPILILVMNNRWGISTSYETQHGEQRISDRGKAFGIRTMNVDGNNVEESYHAIQEAMAYVRRERKPVIMEAQVSRLYGHSSASGANFHAEEPDPIQLFEKKLIADGVLTEEKVKKLHADYDKQMLEYAKEVKTEPQPEGTSIHDYTYRGQKGRYW